MHGVGADASPQVNRDLSRIAVVHEWVAAYAGSEQVFEAIAKIFPNADLYALSKEPGVNLDLGGRPVRTTFLDRPALRNHRSATLPAMPFAWRALGKAKYDIVVSSHHAFAHTNRLADGGMQLCYVHTPARYVWSPEIDERGAAWYLAPARATLRGVDKRASERVFSYAANSTAVAGRIQDFWRRDATVIFPPVRVEYFAENADDEPPTRDYILGVGRWIPYKNLHRVIEVASAVGMPVKIAGRGPDKSRLVAAAAAANVPVELIEGPTDSQLRDLYRNAACLVFPTVEDFGIVPVEAQAAGTPVVALAEGGALDTIRSGFSGILVEDTTIASLAASVLECLALDPQACRDNSLRFSSAHFSRAILEWFRRGQTS